ncbi:unnamed protein product [Symbiodinium sp. CCMP2592]|nr:unnamed protein product [Symbiodinium sp. CCMP2592]
MTGPARLPQAAMRRGPTGTCGEQFPSRNECAAEGNEAEGLPRTPTRGTRRRRRNRKAANAPKSSGTPHLVWRPKSGTCGEQFPKLDGLPTTPRSMLDGRPVPFLKPPRKSWGDQSRRTDASTATGGPSDSEDVSDGECGHGLSEGHRSIRRRHRNVEKRNDHLLTTPRGKQHFVWRPKSGTCGEQLPLPDPESGKSDASTATGGKDGPFDSEDVRDGESGRGLSEGYRCEVQALRENNEWLRQRVQELESKCREMELRLAELSRAEEPGAAVPENGRRNDRSDAACQTEGEDCSVGWSLPEISSLPEVSTDPESTVVGAADFAPEVLLMKNLLPFMSVEALLFWRVLSTQTRSPQALLNHVSEMGSLERPTSIVAFAQKMRVFAESPDVSLKAAFADDVEQQKFYDCRCWCMILASKHETHFAEAQVRDIVDKNLQSLLRHCQSADDSLSKASHDVIQNYAADGLPFVQQSVAETLLCRMEKLVESGIPANMRPIWRCAQNLQLVVRSLDKPQRQKLVSLLVKLLPEIQNKAPVIQHLERLWRADDDPRRSYAEAHQQLRILAKSISGDVRQQLKPLIYGFC